MPNDPAGGTPCVSLPFPLAAPAGAALLPYGHPVGGRSVALLPEHATPACTACEEYPASRGDLCEECWADDAPICAQCGEPYEPEDGVNADMTDDGDDAYDVECCSYRCARAWRDAVDDEREYRKDVDYSWSHR